MSKTWRHTMEQRNQCCHILDSETFQCMNDLNESTEFYKNVVSKKLTQSIYILRTIINSIEFGKKLNSEYYGRKSVLYSIIHRYNKFSSFNLTTLLALPPIRRGYSLFSSFRPEWAAGHLICDFLTERVRRHPGRQSDIYTGRQKHKPKGWYKRNLKIFSLNSQEPYTVFRAILNVSEALTSKNTASPSLHAEPCDRL